MNNDFKNEEQSYCVYKHTNFVNGKVYIGITSKEPSKRWNGGYGYLKNEYFWRSIQKYGWNEGFKHEILFHSLTEEEACQKEIELIKYYNSTDSRYGYNHDPGGRHISYKTKMKISDNSKSKKPVLQYSKNGELIAEYASRSDASKATGVNICSISDACCGDILSAGGYFWCDRDDTGKIDNDLEKYREKMPRVLQFDLDGNLLCVYNHVYDASDKTGIERYQIFGSCFDKLKSLSGFLFCYEGDENRVKKWVKGIKKENDKSSDDKNKIKKRSAGPGRLKKSMKERFNKYV